MAYNYIKSIVKQSLGILNNKKLYPKLYLKNKNPCKYMIYKGFESVLVALTDVNNSFEINDCQRVKLNNINVFEGFNKFVFFDDKR